MPTARACVTTMLRSRGTRRTPRAPAMRPPWWRPAAPACSTASRPIETPLALRIPGDETEALAVGLAEMRAAVGRRHGDDLALGHHQPLPPVPGAEQPVVAQERGRRSAIALLAVDRSIAAARSDVGLLQILVPVVILRMAIAVPALSIVEGPALSIVEGPALSIVEGPAGRRGRLRHRRERRERQHEHEPFDRHDHGAASLHLSQWHFDCMDGMGKPMRCHGRTA